MSATRFKLNKYTPPNLHNNFSFEMRNGKWIRILSWRLLLFTNNETEQSNQKWLSKIKKKGLSSRRILRDHVHLWWFGKNLRSWTGKNISIYRLRLIPVAKLLIRNKLNSYSFSECRNTNSLFRRYTNNHKTIRMLEISQSQSLWAITKIPSTNRRRISPGREVF